jgi:hypothetical protein
MKTTKALALCLALALPGTLAFAQQIRTVTTYTNGSGSATESDRGQAMDEATEQAQNWANSSCMGTVTNTNTTSSSCIKLGSDDENNVTYTCMVAVKATCEIQYRGK